MNYCIKCSKCPALADSHIYSRLRQSYTALSVAFSDKADQINESAFQNLGTGFGFCCSFCYDSSIAPKPDNPVDLIWVNWGHSSLLMKSKAI